MMMVMVNCFLLWLTYELAAAIFVERTIIRRPHHPNFPTHPDFLDDWNTSTWRYYYTTVPEKHFFSWNSLILHVCSVFQLVFVIFFWNHCNWKWWHIVNCIWPKHAKLVHITMKMLECFITQDYTKLDHEIQQLPLKITCW